MLQKISKQFQRSPKSVGGSTQHGRDMEGKVAMAISQG